MRSQAAFTCLIALLCSACTVLNTGPATDGSIQTNVTGTDQAIEQFLVGRDLDPVEGAWGQDENMLEVVIARNNFQVASDYDYVGFVTQSDQPDWNRGDVKLLLRSTDTANIYDGVWLTRYKSRRTMTFVVEQEDLIQARYIANDGNTNFVRIRRIDPSFASIH
jgi:hypothetical protein